MKNRAPNTTRPSRPATPRLLVEVTVHLDGHQTIHLEQIHLTLLGRWKNAGCGSPGDGNLLLGSTSDHHWIIPSIHINPIIPRIFKGIHLMIIPRSDIWGWIIPSSSHIIPSTTAFRIPLGKRLLQRRSPGGNEETILPENPHFFSRCQENHIFSKVKTSIKRPCSITVGLPEDSLRV